jgi:hypothetical protein
MPIVSDVLYSTFAADGSENANRWANIRVLDTAKRACVNSRGGAATYVAEVVLAPQNCLHMSQGRRSDYESG